MIVDLKKELDAIRNLDGIVEKSLGVFYLKRIPFMHFHFTEGKRWADVKTFEGYKQVLIPMNASSVARKKFLRAIELAYSRLFVKNLA